MMPVCAIKRAFFYKYQGDCNEVLVKNTTENLFTTENAESSDDF